MVETRMQNAMVRKRWDEDAEDVALVDGDDELKW